MKNSYVEAFTKSILTGTDVSVALENLKALLKRKGHERLFSTILHASVRVLTAKLKSALPQVTVAAEGSVSKEVLMAAIKSLDSTLDPRVVVDSTLIGGYTARVKGLFIDASYKHKLLQLYRSIAGNQHQ